MKRLATAALVLLTIAGCGEDERRNATEPAPSEPAAPAPPPEAAEKKAPTSIMRPSVAAEAEPPAPPPVRPTQATVYFARGVMSLSDEARTILDGLLAEPAVAAGGPIIIRGHSDSRGHDGDNLVASAKRAQSVFDYLRAKGIVEARMTTIALGEGRPIAPNLNEDGSDNPEGRAKNRRVEIEVGLPPSVPTEEQDPQQAEPGPREN